MINYWALLRPQQDRQDLQPPPVPPSPPAGSLLHHQSCRIYGFCSRPDRPAPPALEGRLQLPKLHNSWEKASRSHLRAGAPAAGPVEAEVAF